MAYASGSQLGVLVRVRVPPGVREKFEVIRQKFEVENIIKSSLTS